MRKLPTTLAVVGLLLVLVGGWTPTAAEPWQREVLRLSGGLLLVAAPLQRAADRWAIPGRHRWPTAALVLAVLAVVVGYGLLFVALAAVALAGVAAVGLSVADQHHQRVLNAVLGAKRR